MLFSSIWFDLAGINSADVCREKSKAAILRERFAKDEFDKVRRLLEYTRVFNNEMIIRNSCRFRSTPSPMSQGATSKVRTNHNNDNNNNNNNNNLFQRLPEIVLLRIFQFARPKNYQVEHQAAKWEGVGGSPRTYLKHQMKDPWRKVRKESTIGKLMERNELAEASGGSPRDASCCCQKRSIDRISGIRYHTFPIARTIPSEITVDFYPLETTDHDTKNTRYANNHNHKARHRAVDMIDSLQRPDWVFSTTLLNPETYMTGPCFRDFKRYVKSFPGWTAERFVATREERESFCICKKNKVYFLKIFYQNSSMPKSATARGKRIPHK